MPRKKKHSQFIEGRPKVKERPRMTRRGRVFTPKRTLDYERQIAEAYNGPMFESDRLAVHLSFSRKGVQIEISEAELKPEHSSGLPVLRGDIDNYAKAIMDALNGVAYEDDKQIVVLIAEKK